MKRAVKIVLVVLVLATCVGLAVFKLAKGRSAAHVGGDDDDDHPSSEVPSDTLVSVQTGSLKLVTLHEYVHGYGTVEPAPATSGEPAASAQLAAPSAGVVSHVDVVEGQHVNKGDVVVELDSSSMTAAFAREEVARQKELYARQNTSQRNLQNAEAQLALLRVVSPLSGTVTRVNVKPGGAVDLNTVVAEVVNMDRLAVRTQLPASQSADVRTGQEVQLETQPPLTATLGFVSPSVDANSGTISVWAALRANNGLRPGQFVRLQIVTATHTNCLAAPAESVVTDENGQSTIALVQGDTAVQTSVNTGLRENGWVEIQGAGLKTGDIVVTVGAYGLPDKTKISIVNSTNSAVAK